MVKQLALSILLVGSSGVAFAVPHAADISQPRYGVFAYSGENQNIDRREIIVERRKNPGSNSPSGTNAPKTSNLPSNQAPPSNPNPPSVPASVAAPEMDPASMISSLTLLIGGLAVVVAARRRAATNA
jgi:hypothetical protein